MKRTEYHRAYYQRNAERRRKSARENKARREWMRWLLLEFGVPAEVVHGQRKAH